jgi:predicted nucleic acid-binding protein
LNAFLLDTNCISEDTLPKPNPGVSAWLHQVDQATLYLSVLTVGEIRKGIEALVPGRRRTQLEIWLDGELRALYGAHLLPVTERIADRWGRLHVHAQRQGRPLPVIDGLLAATALEHNLTLVTRNVRDFAHVPVPLFSPWKT